MSVDSLARLQKPDVQTQISTQCEPDEVDFNVFEADYQRRRTAFIESLVNADNDILTDFMNEVIASANEKAIRQPGGGGLHPDVRNAITDTAMKALGLRPLEEGEA